MPDGEARRLTADDVNAALRSHFGGTTSARDFRNFRASSLTAGAMREIRDLDERQRGRSLKDAIRASSEFLANTPTVARQSYVHPLVQAKFVDVTFDPTPLFSGPLRDGLTRDETAFMRLLSRDAEAT